MTIAEHGLVRASRTTNGRHGNHVLDPRSVLSAPLPVSGRLRHLAGIVALAARPYPDTTRHAALLTRGF
jgi:hypothetical protein